MSSLLFSLLLSLGFSGLVPVTAENSKIMNTRCVGAGSNVVDRFYRLRAIPKVGEKGYFNSPLKILEASVVGGVTLNHLAWGACLDVPSTLIALQVQKPPSIYRTRRSEAAFLSRIPRARYLIPRGTMILANWSERL